MSGRFIQPCHWLFSYKSTPPSPPCVCLLPLLTVSAVPTVSHAQIHKNPHNPTLMKNCKQFKLSQGWSRLERVYLYEIHQKPSWILFEVRLVWFIGDWGMSLRFSSRCEFSVLTALWTIRAAFAFVECCHACSHSSLSTSLAVFVISHLLNHQRQLHPFHIVRLYSSPVQSFVALWFIFCLIIWISTLSALCLFDFWYIYLLWCWPLRPVMFFIVKNHKT